jgi:septum formation topological specificity factor MinE
MVRHSLPTQGIRSGKTAKERLIQMMLEEHTQCTPQVLSCMEHDLTRTISKYLPVSDKNICLYVKRSAGRILLFTVTELSAIKKDR